MLTSTFHALCARNQHYWQLHKYRYISAAAAAAVNLPYRPSILGRGEGTNFQIGVSKMVGRSVGLLLLLHCSMWCQKDEVFSSVENFLLLASASLRPSFLCKNVMDGKFDTSLDFLFLGFVHFDLVGWLVACHCQFFCLFVLVISVKALCYKKGVGFVWIKGLLGIILLAAPCTLDI